MACVKAVSYGSHMEHNAGALSPTAVIAARVRELRQRNGWTADQLAERMTAEGVPWSRIVVTKLETGRRPSVSAEELLTLAYVLSVAPVHLLVPTADRDESGEHVLYRVTPNGPTSVPSFVRAWVRGQTPIAKVVARRYFSEVPESEWEPPTDQWTPENIERQSRAVGDGGER